LESEAIDEAASPSGLDAVFVAPGSLGMSELLCICDPPQLVTITRLAHMTNTQRKDRASFIATLLLALETYRTNDGVAVEGL
jgi:hypothetical protein